MNKHKQKKRFLKYLFQLIVLTGLDYIIIRLWILRIDPDPSVSIGLLFLVPAVFILNIIIAIVLVFIKKQYSGLFFMNSFIASVLFYFLFTDGISRHQNKRYESWKFNLRDTAFDITLSKLDTTFSISYRTSPSSSIEFMDGRYIVNPNGYVLTTGVLRMTIKNEIFFGFRGDTESIRLTKIEQ
jgi:hypothetical protein